MNNIINDPKWSVPEEPGREGADADVALGGNQYSSNTRPPQRPMSLEEISERKGEVDGSAQITLTFDQLMELIKKTSAPAEEKREESPPPKKANPTPEESGEAGTRVIFQADDFDASEPKPKRTFVSYDEDEIFNDEDVSRETIERIRQNRARSTYTPISASDDRFAVSEVEYESAALPELRQRRVGQAPPIVSGKRSNVPYMMNSPSRRTHVGNVEIEEVEYVEENPISDDFSQPKETPAPKKKSGGEKARRVILIVAIIAIIASGAYLGWEYFMHKENEKFEEENSNLIINVPTTESTKEATTKKAKDKKKKKDKKETTTKKEETTTAPIEKTIEEMWADVKREHPNVVFPENMQLKYANFYAINSDFIGYLEVPGTKLLLPIVQKKDETDAENSYLNKTFNKQSRKYGCPFVSNYNSIGNNYLDYNTVIFGHYMKDKSIFGALDKYKSLEGYKTAPVIYFNTLYNDYTWKVIAAFVTNDKPEDDNNYKFEYSRINLTDNSKKKAFLNELAKRSIYDTGVSVNENDKLLTLSTCTYEFENARFVVVARLLRSGEKADVDVSKAFVNSSPRYPQAYYDAKKLTNPYIGDNNWSADK